MDREPNMLDENETIDVEASSGEHRPRERLRRLTSKLAGVRVLAAASVPSIAIEVEADGSAEWLAVADGAGQLDALRSGAAGVVSGHAGAKELAAAVEAVRQGHAVLPVGLMRDLIGEGEDRQIRAPGPSLTPRETSVLSLLSEGATNKMIARRLEISVHTAKFHVASILDKLDATTRTDAVAQGVRQGLLML